MTVLPTAEQIASNPSGSRVPEGDMHLSELADLISGAARARPERQDRFLAYAERWPDPWKTRLTLELLAVAQAKSGRVNGGSKKEQPRKEGGRSSAGHRR